MVAIQFYGGHPVCMPLIVGHSAIQQQLYCKLISGKYECCLTHNLESSLFDSLNYFMYDISGLCVVRPKNDRCCMTLAALHQSDTAHSKKISSYNYIIIFEQKDTEYNYKVSQIQFEDMGCLRLGNPGPFAKWIDLSSVCKLSQV